MPSAEAQESLIAQARERLREVGYDPNAFDAEIVDRSSCVAADAPTVSEHSVCLVPIRPTERLYPIRAENQSLRWAGEVREWTEWQRAALETAVRYLRQGDPTLPQTSDLLIWGVDYDRELVGLVVDVPLPAGVHQTSRVVLVRRTDLVIVVPTSGED